jgi:ABC-type nitrate/sulfonate/bicarbonate transport system ATPase subunit
MSVIDLEKVTCTFGQVTVLENFQLSVGEREFLAIVGPSGCGKTTLLNLIAQNLQPTSGKVRVAGKTRTVYQQDGLFPWLTVRENIRLGLRHLTTQSAQESALIELLKLIGLENFGNHYPHELSGGMKQRVELIRALASETDILLMDEPFSALDYLTRLRLRQELSRMLAERPRTVVLVTHDIEEAAQLADRIVVLSPGPTRIRREVQVNAPRPRNATAPTVVSTIHLILAEMGLEDNLPTK